MDLNDLLRNSDIEPSQVLVFRHRPFEPELNKVLPLLAAEKPTVFNAYQQTQKEKLEKVMTSAAYVASFIGHEPGKALFVGLYSIRTSKTITRDEYWQIPENVEMKKFGMKGFTEEDGRSSCLWFDLALTEFYPAWKGKLVVDWPPPERSWWRRAHKNKFAVVAILEENRLVPARPNWREMVFAWHELEVLPNTFKSVLSQWRAVYYIIDTSDGKAYVGSAYGDENLFGRWTNYASSGHGGNTLLRTRDPRNFMFSILERVSPDMEANEVIQLENTWKTRLRTRKPYGLNDN